MAPAHQTQGAGTYDVSIHPASLAAPIATSISQARALQPLSVSTALAQMELNSIGPNPASAASIIVFSTMRDADWQTHGSKEAPIQIFGGTPLLPPNGISFFSERCPQRPSPRRGGRHRTIDHRFDARRGIRLASFVDVLLPR